MFPSTFWVKYIFRVLHIGSLVTICHAIITAKITGNTVKEHKTLYMVAGILAMLSGTPNPTQASSTPTSSNPRTWGTNASLG